MFMQVCLHLDDVNILWELTNRADFRLKFYWILLESRLQ